MTPRGLSQTKNATLTSTTRPKSQYSKRGIWTVREIGGNNMLASDSSDASFSLNGSFLSPSFFLLFIHPLHSTSIPTNPNFSHFLHRNIILFSGSFYVFEFILLQPITYIFFVNFLLYYCNFHFLVCRVDFCFYFLSAYFFTNARKW